MDNAHLNAVVGAVSTIIQNDGIVQLYTVSDELANTAFPLSPDAVFGIFVKHDAVIASRTGL